MTLVIGELQTASQLDSAEVDAFLAENEFPIVDGTKVTFVWRGHADEVNLRHWIYSLESAMPFTCVHGTDIWFLHMELPERSRVEYKLEVIQHGRRQLLKDPLNPHLALDPFGANSVVHGEGHERPDWTLEDSEARPGTIAEHSIKSKAFGEQRDYQVYLPARFHSSRRYPLLIVHDGFDFLRFAELQTALDNLIHRLEIPPLIAALTQSPNRMHEYADDENHAKFLAGELVPEMEQLYPLVGTPSARALMGASFGAVASLSTAWRNPGVFGNLLLCSGSFAFTDIGEHQRGPAFDPIVPFVNAFRADPGRPVDKVYLSCGTYESLIYENRSMVPLLQETGMSVRWSEVRDGHNWENWRDRLREGLSWIFPGPLWMVYE